MDVQGRKYAGGTTRNVFIVIFVISLIASILNEAQCGIRSPTFPFRRKRSPVEEPAQCKNQENPCRKPYPPGAIGNPFETDVAVDVTNSNSSQNENMDGQYNKISGIKTKTVHNPGAYTSICWIEIITIKEIMNATSTHRSVVREYAISFESPADIPDKYVMNNTDSDDKTVEYEIFDRDTRKSKMVNFTTVSETENMVIRENRQTICGSGPIYTKEITDWPSLNRRRIVIRVSPLKKVVELPNCTNEATATSPLPPTTLTFTTMKQDPSKQTTESTEHSKTTFKETTEPSVLSTKLITKIPSVSTKSTSTVASILTTDIEKETIVPERTSNTKTTEDNIKVSSNDYNTQTEYTTSATHLMKQTIPTNIPTKETADFDTTEEHYSTTKVPATFTTTNINPTRLTEIITSLPPKATTKKYPIKASTFDIVEEYPYETTNLSESPTKSSSKVFTYSNIDFHYTTPIVTGPSKKETDTYPIETSTEMSTDYSATEEQCDTTITPMEHTKTEINKNNEVSTDEPRVTLVTHDSPSLSPGELLTPPSIITISTSDISTHPQQKSSSSSKIETTTVPSIKSTTKPSQPSTKSSIGITTQIITNEPEKHFTSKNTDMPIQKTTYVAETSTQTSTKIYTPSYEIQTTKIITEESSTELPKKEIIRQSTETSSESTTEISIDINTTEKSDEKVTTKDPETSIKTSTVSLTKTSDKPSTEISMEVSTQSTVSSAAPLTKSITFETSTLSSKVNNPTQTPEQIITEPSKHLSTTEKSYDTSITTVHSTKYTAVELTTVTSEIPHVSETTQVPKQTTTEPSKDSSTTEESCDTPTTTTASEINTKSSATLSTKPYDKPFTETPTKSSTSAKLSTIEPTTKTIIAEVPIESQETSADVYTTEESYETTTTSSLKLSTKNTNVYTTKSLGETSTEISTRPSKVITSSFAELTTKAIIVESSTEQPKKQTTNQITKSSIQSKTEPSKNFSTTEESYDTPTTTLFSTEPTKKRKTETPTITTTAQSIKSINVESTTVSSKITHISTPQDITTELSTDLNTTEEPSDTPITSIVPKEDHSSTVLATKSDISSTETHKKHLTTTKPSTEATTTNGTVNQPSIEHTQNYTTIKSTDTPIEITTEPSIDLSTTEESCDTPTTAASEIPTKSTEYTKPSTSITEPTKITTVENFTEQNKILTTNQRSKSSTETTTSKINTVSETIQTSKEISTTELSTDFSTTEESCDTATTAVPEISTKSTEFLTITSNKPFTEIPSKNPTPITAHTIKITTVETSTEQSKKLTTENKKSKTNVVSETISPKQSSTTESTDFITTEDSRDTSTTTTVPEIQTKSSTTYSTKSSDKQTPGAPSTSATSTTNTIELTTEQQKRHTANQNTKIPIENTTKPSTDFSTTEEFCDTPSTAVPEIATKSSTTFSIKPFNKSTETPNVNTAVPITETIVNVPSYEQPNESTTILSIDLSIIDEESSKSQPSTVSSTVPLTKSNIVAPSTGRPIKHITSQSTQTLIENTTELSTDFSTTEESCDTPSTIAQDIIQFSITDSTKLTDEPSTQIPTKQQYLSTSSLSVATAETPIETTSHIITSNTEIRTTTTTASPINPSDNPSTEIPIKTMHTSTESSTAPTITKPPIMSSTSQNDEPPIESSTKSLTHQSTPEKSKISTSSSIKPSDNQPTEKLLQQSTESSGLQTTKSITNAHSTEQTKVFTTSQSSIEPSTKPSSLPLPWSSLSTLTITNITEFTTLSNNHLKTDHTTESSKFSTDFVTSEPTAKTSSIKHVTEPSTDLSTTEEPCDTTIIPLETSNSTTDYIDSSNHTSHNTIPESTHTTRTTEPSSTPIKTTLFVTELPKELTTEEPCQSTITTEVPITFLTEKTEKPETPESHVKSTTTDKTCEEDNMKVRVKINIDFELEKTENCVTDVTYLGHLRKFESFGEDSYLFKYLNPSSGTIDYKFMNLYLSTLEARLDVYNFINSLIINIQKDFYRIITDPSFLKETGIQSGNDIFEIIEKLKNKYQRDILFGRGKDLNVQAVAKTGAGIQALADADAGLESNQFGTFRPKSHAIAGLNINSKHRNNHHSRYDDDFNNDRHSEQFKYHMHPVRIKHEPKRYEQHTFRYKRPRFQYFQQSPRITQNGQKIRRHTKVRNNWRTV